MNRQTKIILTLVMLSLFVLTSFALYQKSNLENILANKELSGTFIPVREDKEAWEAESDLSYYVFADESSITIETFNREVLLAADYAFIGNGVFLLSDNKGYILRSTEGLTFDLTEEYPHIVFNEYQYFAQ